jgi:membrane fusion protein (multidrug efflux system)
MAVSKAKKIIIFFIILVVVLVILGGIKAYMFKQEMAAFSKMAPPPPTISTVKVDNMNYQKTDTAVGTFKAVSGVDVTSQVSGEIVHKFIHSGEVVKKGQPLIQLDNRTAKTTLATDQAAFENAHLTMLRDQRLLKTHTISQSTFDNDFTAFKQTRAAMIAAEVALSQHTIKAPFAGKLGITQVDIGQFINPGESLVSLQTQSPIHFNFNLPEKDLADLVINGRVEITIDRYPNRYFLGKITAINSTIDPDTHTIAVQATLPNKSHYIFPGGFGTAQVYLGKPTKVLGILNTAVTYRLYGDSAYIITSANSKGKTIHTATLNYIHLGDPINANYTAVNSGLKAGDEVVAAGQNKLQQKNIVLINNTTPQTINPLKQFA